MTWDSADMPRVPDDASGAEDGSPRVIPLGVDSAERDRAVREVGKAIATLYSGVARLARQTEGRIPADDLIDAVVVVQLQIDFGGQFVALTAAPPDADGFWSIVVQGAPEAPDGMAGGEGDWYYTQGQRGS